MAINKFPLFLISSLFATTLPAFDSIDEALKNGITKGDVGFITNYLKPKYSYTMAQGTNQASKIQEGYYLGSTMGIHYRSAFYKNMRLSVGFRAAYPLYQLRKSTFWGYSDNDLTRPNRGDMAMDFDPFHRVLVSDTYLEYFDGDTSIKGGRFYIQNEWADNQIDGFWIRNRSFQDLMLEFFWAGQYGEITPSTMTAFNEPEPHHSGYFYTAAKYYFKDIFWIKFYMLSAYSVAFGMGASANAEYKFSSSKIGLTLHSAGSFEFQNGQRRIASNSKYTLLPSTTFKGGDGIDFDAKFYVEGKVKEVDLGFNLGYIQTGKNSGWGSLNLLNNTISPLGLGYVFDYGIVDTSLFYVNLYTTFDAITLSLLYGTASFQNKASGSSKYYRQNEIDFTMTFNFTKNVSAFFNVYNTHLGNDGLPTTTEVQAGLTLSF